MLHAATDRATLRKVEDCSTFPATRLAIFVARQVAKRGCYTRNFFCNLSRNGVALQVARKIASCNSTFTRQSLFLILCSYAFRKLIQNRTWCCHFSTLRSRGYHRQSVDNPLEQMYWSRIRFAVWSRGKLRSAECGVLRQKWKMQNMTSFSIKKAFEV